MAISNHTNIWTMTKQELVDYILDYGLLPIGDGRFFRYKRYLMSLTKPELLEIAKRKK